METLVKTKKKLLAFCIVFLTLAVAVPGKPSLSRLDRYFETERQEWKIPGMAVAIVKDGRVVLAKGYGSKEFSKPEKVDENTLFAIASNTKAFTAAALAMLVDRGKIHWDDKVRDYLPYFKLCDPYATEEMTVRDLLCHCSGLKTFSGDLIWYETPYSTVEIIKRARYLKPAYSFRSEFGYSNIMFMAAGEVVSAVAGTPWKDFVRGQIFEPLGMKTSIIGTTDLKNYTHVAAAHYVYLDGKTVTVPYSSSDNLGGAGSINSTVRDMAQWLIMLLNDGVYAGKRLLSEDSIWEMWSSHMINRISRSANKLFPKTHFRNYGLGWGLSDYHGYKVIGHGGGLDGMISQVALVPEIKLGLVILTNSINNLPTALAYKIIDAYLGIGSRDWSRFYLERYREFEKREMQRGTDITKKQGKAANAEVKLEDYAGIYGGAMYGDAQVTLQQGKLVLELLPAPIFISDLTHLHFDTFLLKLRNTLSFVPHGIGTVQFIRDKQGEVVEMKLDIPNNDFWFDELEFRKKSPEPEAQ